MAALGALVAGLPFGSGTAELPDGETRHPVTDEVLRRIRQVEIRARVLASDLLIGSYRSVFRGSGLDFEEVREYEPGDDVRSIDWNVTARMRRPYVKRYVEERELTVMIAVDMSGSGQFGTRGRFKSELASELSAVLAMSAIRNNDRVGTMLFTDAVEHVVPPRKGRRHAMRLMRDMLAFRPAGRGTDIGGATEYLNKMLPSKAIVFLVSDFLAPGLERPLKLLAQRHDLIAVTVEDPSELDLPDVGLARLADPETGQVIDIDTSDLHVRRAYAKRVLDESEVRKKLLRRLAIDEVLVRTNAGIIEPLFRFFRQRETRQGRR